MSRALELLKALAEDAGLTEELRHVWELTEDERRALAEGGA